MLAVENTTNIDKLNKLERGVMFWAKPDADATIREAKEFGVRCGQLGIGGDFALEGAAPAYQEALRAHDFTLVTVFAAFTGEDYKDIPTVESTVGFVPQNTRAEREERMLAVADFASQLGVPSVACHIGFVPEPSASGYPEMLDLVRRICDHAANLGQRFVLETGQEPAKALLEFLHDVGRDNLGINFDPANMILYGTGDPVEAFEILAKNVVTIHAKDGDWPDKSVAGSLGKERPLGEGSVDFPKFVAKVRELGYTGTLHVEREAEDPAERKRDIARGLDLLNSLIPE
jgi:L-ribulose-5-phosphate 3-epimerase